MPIRSYRDLEAYQRSRNLIVPTMIDEYTVVAKQLNKLIQNWR